MSSLLNVLVTALAALVGAWAGAQVALQRFKKERAFDLRADWYRRAVSAMLDISTKMGEFEIAVAKGGPDLEGLSDRLLADCAEVGGHVRESVLFGDQASVRAIGEISEMFVQFARSVRSGEEVLPVVANARRVVFDAARVIAREGRQHLGLEDMPEVLPPSLIADFQDRED